MDKARYSTLKRSLEALLNDFEILAGNDVPAQGASMRDVIGTAMLNAGALHAELKKACQLSEHSPLDERYYDPSQAN